MSTILRDLENIHERCENFLEGLSEKRPSVVKELDAWLSGLFEQIQNQRVLNQQLKNEVPYLYEFFQKAIVLMLKNCSPGAVGVLSIYIIQFVGYNLLNENPGYVDLLLLLFSDSDFLTKFRNLTPVESEQYNALMSGAYEGYIAHPHDCLFGKKLESGVDFIALTCQNFGRRGYFSVLLSTILNAQDFSQVDNCIQFLYASFNSMDDNFRLFLGVWFAANLGNQNDERYEGFSAIHLTRLMFCISVQDQCLDISSTLYSNCLTAAASANQPSLIIEEMVEITKQTNHHPVIDKICGHILNLLLQTDINVIADLIIATTKYLENSDFLDKEFVYQHVVHNAYIIENLFPILQSAMNFTEVYMYLRENIQQNFKFMLKLFPVLDPTSIPTIGDDLLTILFLMPRDEVDVFIQICALNQFKLFFANSLMIFLDNNKDWNYDTLDLVSRASELVDIVDKNKIFRIIIRTITGDKIIKILNDHNLIPVLDLNAVIKASDGSPLVYNFIRERFFDRVFEVSPTLPRTSGSLSLIFDAFLTENGYLAISHPPYNPKHRDAMWNALFMSYTIGAPFYLRLAVRFFSGYAMVNPQQFASDVMMIIKSPNSKMLAAIMKKFDLSKFNPKIFYDQLETTPEAMIAIHCIQNKPTYTYDEQLIQKIKTTSLIERAIILDAAIIHASDAFFALLKPNARCLLDVFSVASNNVGYMYVMRLIALMTFKRCPIDVNRQNLDVVADFAIMCGYKDLFELAIGMYPANKPAAISDLVQTFRGTTRDFAMTAVDFLLAGDYDNAKISACLRCCTAESMQEVIPKIKDWSDEFALEVYGRFKMVVDTGSCTPRLVELIFEHLPMLPQINADMVSYFLSCDFPFYLRSDNAIRLFFSRYKSGCGPLLHAIDTAQPTPASSKRTILEKFDECPSLNSTLYALANYLPVVYVSTTLLPVSHYSMDLTRIAFAYNPAIQSSFSQQMSGITKVTDVYKRVINLLPQEIRQLTCFMIGDEEDIYDVIEVKLVDAYRSFLNTFFNINGHKRKMGHPPPLLAIHLDPPTKDSEIRAMSVPPKVDFKEFIEDNHTATIYELHAVVAFQRSDRKNYNAFVTNSSGGFYQYTEDNCTRASSLPTNFVPELLFYKRVDIEIEKPIFFSHFGESIKNDINNQDRTISRIVEFDEYVFDDYNRTRAFYLLALSLLRKFNVQTLFKSLKDDKNFAGVFFETGLDIIVKPHIFDTVKEEIKSIAQNCPAPDEICRTILPGVNQPQYVENVMHVIMHLRLSLDMVYLVVQTIRTTKEVAAKLPGFAQFVEPLFNDSNRGMLILNDKYFNHACKKAKLPGYTKFAAARK